MADETKMTLRLPENLRARLERTAARSRRSMHAQMLIYIERGLDQDDPDDQGQEGER